MVAVKDEVWRIKLNNFQIWGVGGGEGTSRMNISGAEPGSGSGNGFATCGLLVPGLVLLAPPGSSWFAKTDCSSCCGALRLVSGYLTNI